MDFKVGDKVKLNLKKEIKGSKAPPSTIALWKALHGRVGTITEIMDDGEIWIVGSQGVKRAFNSEVIEHVSD